MSPEPSLVEIAAKLDALSSTVERIARTHSLRAQWTLPEFAELVGLSPEALAKRRAWRRYGGMKRGGRVVFPEAARLAVSQGKNPNDPK